LLLPKRTAIITGGARGIGRAISLKFAEEGCSVAIADLREKEANQTLEEIKEKGVEGIFIQCDHTDSRQVGDMVDKVIKKLGKIDILVNNAGGFGPSTPITDLTEEAWDKSIDLNLKGVFLCCKAVIPHMIKNKYGKIINISSLAALTAGPANPHYSASKGGVLSLTFDLCLEVARYGICVNAIMPGIIQTDMWNNQIPVGVDKNEFFQHRAKSLIPLQRAGTPEDVAGVALFLASSLSDYVTGERIIVGGGLPFHAPAH
jgi:NAD(P)-dependent dehydrogenase (short-subunit alcohol dehydrogenase family)